ncbi:hypothetical protein CAMGR0001_2389 [Campylobacter gracilis RM3268]|uniref:Uncharacterized protein n=1 Tax=Campylobacter gracilis RM3268 TaxID=553220 RepID=C8PE39_9BACT|nr:hypothetical protein CAMGR0001_2389 [Campylobacter gracilis RM3268]
MKFWVLKLHILVGSMVSGEIDLHKSNALSINETYNKSKSR